MLKGFGLVSGEVEGVVRGQGATVTGSLPNSE